MFTVKEESFVQMIVKMLEEKCSAQFMMAKLEKILDEDSEKFIVQMWRFIIFEQLKIKYKIIK